MGRSAILGNHIYFLPEGTTIDVVTVASNAKPDNDPATNWTDYKLGGVEEATINNEVQTTTIRTPLDDVGSGVPGGVYQDKDEFVRQQNVEIDFTLVEITPTVWRSIWLSGEITDGGGGTGAFVPLSQSGFVKGWARLSQYDSLNQLVSKVEFWSQLRISGPAAFGEDVAKIRMNLKVFANPLNTGTLSSFF